MNEEVVKTIQSSIIDKIVISDNNKLIENTKESNDF
jgi:hypothetical protein